MVRDMPIFEYKCGDCGVLTEFLEAAKRKAPTPLNVYDAVDWSAISPLSIESVANGSAPAKFPEFSRGKWKEQQDRIYYGV